MRKNVFGRQLKRDTNERKALFKGLLSSLVLYDRIQTTQAKAKSIKGTADKIIGFAKKESPLLAKRLLSSYLNPLAIEKCLTDVAPRFTERTSGFTRIVRLGPRVSDHAAMVLLEWVEKKKMVPALLPKQSQEKIKKSESKEPILEKKEDKKPKKAAKTQKKEKK